MALTHELDKKDGPVARWFDTWLPNTRPISHDWNARVKGRPIHRPDTDHRIPSTVGAAFDYRLRYSLALTPVEQTMAATGMALLNPALDLPTTRAVPTIVLAPRDRPPVSATAASALVAEFKATLETTLERLAPVGRHLEDDDEKLLCRYCYVLALFEELYRAGLQINSPLYSLKPHASLGDLLAIPPSIWIDDLTELTRLARPHLNELSRSPLHLNPGFRGSNEIGGADADLIADGTLIEVKTTIDPKFRRSRLLNQLLGYVLLDYDDAYAIDSIAVYLSRQALLVRWPLDALLRTLLDGKQATLPALRQSFRDAVRASRRLARPSR